MDRFAPFEPCPRLALALSGGPDSMALLALSRDWVAARDGELLALIVDHGLRPGSAAEATRVAGWAEALGVPAEILRWRGEKPMTRIQERAREARYALLRAACRRAGILHLLTAHHREDLAETVALRKARGSGPIGLAGMAAERFFEELRLLRPLLPVPRDRLLATLRAHRLPRLLDPSNLDPRFARARLRRTGPLPVAELLAGAAAAARSRRSLEGELARFCARHLRAHPLGLIEMEAAAWRRLAPELAELVLERALLVAGGGRHPPRRAALARLAAVLRRPGPIRRTLAGCIVEARDDRLRIGREPGRLAPPACCGPGETLLWDRRWRLENRSPRPVTLLPLARLPDPGRRRRLAARAGAAGLPAWYAAGLPLVLEEGRPLGWPLAAAGLAARRLRLLLAPARRLVEPPFAGILVSTFR